MNKKIIIITVAVLISGFLLTSAGWGPRQDGNTEALLASIPVSELSAAEEEGILLMREEEKLARDVYLTLFEKWNLQTFSNIAASESTHMESVKVLIDRYGLNDPVQSDRIGVFTNPEMQNLYNELTVRGSQSLTEAIRVGIAVEELDIRDLDNLLMSTGLEDLKTVYRNLLAGSENHLRAFQRQLR